MCRAVRRLAWLNERGGMGGGGKTSDKPATYTAGSPFSFCCFWNQQGSKTSSEPPPFLLFFLTFFFKIENGALNGVCLNISQAVEAYPTSWIHILLEILIDSLSFWACVG